MAQIRACGGNGRAAASIERKTESFQSHGLSVAGEGMEAERMAELAAERARKEWSSFPHDLDQRVLRAI